jgi:hypothetical protein
MLVKYSEIECFKELQFGMEDQKENDLFFLCSVIEHIGRATKNHRSYVVNKIGLTELVRVFKLADVYHCEPIENTANMLIEKSEIEIGKFDNVASCEYNIPTVFDIGKVYKRLITAVSKTFQIGVSESLFAVYNSWINLKIEDLNCSMYFESPEYLIASFTYGEALE